MKTKTEKELERESSADFLKRVGINGYKWAQEFMKIFGNDKDKIDEELMIGWFCNSIMAGYDKGYRKAKEEFNKKVDEFEKSMIKRLKSMQTDEAKKDKIANKFLEDLYIRPLKEEINKIFGEEKSK